MKRYVLAGLLVTTAPLLAQTARPAGGGTACSNLAALTIPGVTVNAAAWSPPASSRFPAPNCLGPTSPLCRYPAVARYTGKGSIDEAANFACVVPQAPAATRTSR